MIIGVPKEIKNNEERVAIIPAGVKALKEKGHRVLVEKSAGVGSGIADSEYAASGAEIIDSAEKIWQQADIVCKVKEPLGPELELLKNFNGKILFTYLHLSGGGKELAEILMKNQVSAIAYETVEDRAGLLPLLTPMSEVAGVLAVQEGTQYLMRKFKGRGVTLGEITGVDSARVAVVGGGVVGTKAARTAAGMGAKVTIFELRQERRDYLKSFFSNYKNVEIAESSKEKLDSSLQESDLVVGAVLARGAAAPKVITREMISRMKPGSVIVDVAIDQGGCTELSRATSHSEPIFYSDNGVLIYCVPNMPSQAARQSTFALTAATIPYLAALADKGLEKAMADDPGFKKGLNVHKGYIVYEPVARDLGLTDKYKQV